MRSEIKATAATEKRPENEYESHVKWSQLMKKSLRYRIVILELIGVNGVLIINQISSQPTDRIERLWSRNKGVNEPITAQNESQNDGMSC
jgi:hypothetical protein